MQRPLLVCPPHKDYKNSSVVAALGALQALYMVRIKTKTLKLFSCSESIVIWITQQQCLQTLAFCFFSFHKAPGDSRGPYEIQRLQGVCFGSVGSTGGGGPKTREAGWRSGERQVGERTGTLPRMPAGVPPLCFVPSADLPAATSVAQTQSEWPLRVWLNMWKSFSRTALCR